MQNQHEPLPRTAVKASVGPCPTCHFPLDKFGLTDFCSVACKVYAFKGWQYPVQFNSHPNIDPNCERT